MNVLRMMGDCPGDRITYGLGYTHYASDVRFKIWDRQTDTTMYRVAPQLKMNKDEKEW